MRNLPAIILALFVLSGCKVRHFDNVMTPYYADDPPAEESDGTVNTDISNARIDPTYNQTTGMSSISNPGMTTTIGGSMFKQTGTTTRSKPVQTTKPKSQPQPTNEPIAGTTKTYKLTILGKPFKNTSMRDNTGKINCNFDSARQCAADYSPGTRVTLTVGSSVYSIGDARNMYYANYFLCNGQRINASSPTITITMNSDYECGAWFEYSY